MTELLGDAAGAGAVRCDPGGVPVAVRLDGRWHTVEGEVARWLVDTDWWRTPARRDYRRCLLAGGECVELALDLDARAWSVVRRYD